MADVKWIKITTDVFDDEKILLIESLPDSYAIIVVWFKLLCLAGKQNNSGVFMMGQMPYTDKMLATIFRMKETTVKMALEVFEQFGMVEIIDGVITIPNWNKHQTLDAYEKKKERDRLYQQERRAVQRQLVQKSSDSQASQSSDVVVSDKEEEKDIEKDIDNNKNSAFDNAPSKQKVSKSEIEAFFESVWKLYPNKKGKGQVSDAKKKILYEIGYEHIASAVERYTKELAKDDWRKPQNGSTFFNSGYVDYLDWNYQPTKDAPRQKAKNSFNNFHQRSYEADALERLALSTTPDYERVENNPELRKEAEALKRMLQEAY